MEQQFEEMVRGELYFNSKEKRSLKNLVEFLNLNDIEVDLISDTKSEIDVTLNHKDAAISVSVMRGLKERLSVWSDWELSTDGEINFVIKIQK